MDYISVPTDTIMPKSKVDCNKSIFGNATYIPSLSRSGKTDRRNEIGLSDQNGRFLQATG